MSGARFVVGSVVVLALSLPTVSCGKKKRIHERVNTVSRPVIPFALQLGEADERSVVVWVKSSRAQKMVVEWAENERFERAVRKEAALIGDELFAGSLRVEDLPATTSTIWIRAAVIDGVTASEWTYTRWVKPTPGGPLRFHWGGDVAGQGWGSDPARGGMRIFESMRKRAPHFFVNAGDWIYADNPLVEEVPLIDGGVWRNPGARKLDHESVSLEDLRERYLYNLRDEHVARYLSSTPVFFIWDDHEVRNNWFPETAMEPRSTAALRALSEMTPFGSRRSQTMFRRIHFGELDLFLLDGRSHRSPNSENREPTGTAFWGQEQLAWLKYSLKESKALWKVIVNDMPLAIRTSDPPREGQPRTEDGIANGDPGAPLGREKEVAGLLSYLKKERIENFVFLTADVHYGAAHRFSPNENPRPNAFRNFEPFFEFVAGPLHAGSFPPQPLDETFGGAIVYVTPLQADSSPAAGGQYFGEVNFDPTNKLLRVSIHDVHGVELFFQTIAPTL